VQVLLPAQGTAWMLWWHYHEVPASLRHWHGSLKGPYCVLKAALHMFQGHSISTASGKDYSADQTCGFTCQLGCGFWAATIELCRGNPAHPDLMISTCHSSLAAP
jgi:hypothetical protein